MSYAHPEVLVSTEWVQEHLNDPKVRIVEVDYDPTANYQLGHIPGAVLFDWRKDLNHPLQRDILSKEQLEQLFNKSGISNDTKIALYGDFNNWFSLRLLGPPILRRQECSTHQRRTQEMDRRGQTPDQRHP